MLYEVLITVSSGYPSVQGRLPTRYSPVRRFPFFLSSEDLILNFSLDLHVLGTPPAFILSQDQTLNLMVYIKSFPIQNIFRLFPVHCLFRHCFLWNARLFAFLCPPDLSDFHHCFLWFRNCTENPFKHRLIYKLCWMISYLYKITVLCSFQGSLTAVCVSAWLVY